MSSASDIHSKTDDSDGFVSRAKRTLSYWYIQYELIFCINMFEPWEKLLLNIIIAVTAIMVCYSSYVYLPNYMRSLVSKSLAYIQLNDAPSV